MNETGIGPKRSFAAGFGDLAEPDSSKYSRLDLECLLKAISDSERLEEPTLFIELVTRAARVLVSQGESREWRGWLEWSNRAMVAAERSGAFQHIGEISFTRARLFFRLGLYSKMEVALDRARSAAETAADERTLASLDYLQGALARKKKDYELSRLYCVSSLKKMRDIGDTYGEAIALYNLAAAEDEDDEGDLSKAAKIFHECLELFRRLGNLDRAARTRVRLARNLSLQGRYEEARRFLLDAEQDIDEIEQPRDWAILQLVTAKVEANLGCSEEAFWRARRTLQIVERQGMRPEQNELYQLLTRLDGTINSRDQL